MMIGMMATLMDGGVKKKTFRKDIYRGILIKVDDQLLEGFGVNGINLRITHMVFSAEGLD